MLLHLPLATKLATCVHYSTTSKHLRGGGDGRALHDHHALRRAQQLHRPATALPPGRCHAAARAAGPAAAAGRARVAHEAGALARGDGGEGEQTGPQPATHLVRGRVVRVREYVGLTTAAAHSYGTV